MEPVYCFKMKETTEPILPDESKEINWENLPKDFIEKYIPGEFRNFNQPLCLLSAQSFGLSTRKTKAISIH